MTWALGWFVVFVAAGVIIRLEGVRCRVDDIERETQGIASDCLVALRSVHDIEENMSRQVVWIQQPEHVVAFSRN